MEQKKIINLLIVLFLLFATAVGASATTMTAVLDWGVDDTGDYGIDNIVNYLGTDPRFSVVDRYDVDVAQPSLATLSGYDSVLVVADNRAGGDAPPAFGDTLKSYADGGGRVVLSTFSWNIGIGVTGGIMGTGYSPLVGVGGNATAGTLNPATIDLSHFVFENYIGNFLAGYASDVILDPGATALALYSNGLTFAAINGGGNVIGLNAFPGNQLNYINSDFGLVFANALNVEPVPEPATMFLLGTGLVGVAGAARRKKKNQA